MGIMKSTRKLPTVLVVLDRVRNPAWKKVYTDETEKHYNMNGYYLPPFEIEAEVLTVHYNTGKMRIRVKSPAFKDVIIREVSNEPFLLKYPF